MNAETFTRAILSKISEKGKWYNDFLVHLFVLYLSLPSRYTYLNMGRYGSYVESTYRRNAGKSHELAKFNFELIQSYLSDEIIWAFDPCFISKSGKKTAHVGYFWSGCAKSRKWGMEISSLAAVDIKQQTSMHYLAKQTPNGLKKEEMLEFYYKLILDEKQQLHSISSILVADAFFSKAPFVQAVTAQNFEFISRFRSDVALCYLYAGPQRGGKGKNLGKGKGSGGGCPKKFDGRVNTKNLSQQYFQLCYADENERGYEAVVYSKALKRKVRVLVVHRLKEDGRISSAKVYFSTNLNRMGIDILLYYRLRFQQEFLFRDAKQHVGLQHCQSTKEEKIDFHINMSLTTINIAKAMHYLPFETDVKPFSMADIKTQYVNKLLLDEAFDLFISVSGISPNVIKNNPRIIQLYNKGKIAA
ncbi:transposase [Aureispira sp. CCB-QB1]|uniref:transposase n=1 Tax=Aureispira sp. CCB-QB1 TaxID=1313421 RepID=UPI000697EFE6|nr:transposase [Aureispira sp. CCB-QB1]